MAERTDVGTWEQFFWTLFAQSKHPIGLFDEEVVIDANPAMCELLGGSHDRIVGLALDDLTPPDERAERRDTFWKLGGWDRQLDLVRLDGSTVRVQQAARAGELDGRRVGFTVSIRLPGEDESCAPRDMPPLTPRETEIVGLVTLGETTPEIAERLVVSPETVRTHVRNAMAKTGARTRAQLVAIALASRRIGPDA